MVVWRLMASHLKDQRKEVVQWSRKTSEIAMGWGRIGDLRKLSPHNSQELKDIVADVYADQTDKTNHANSKRSLWPFYADMKIGDLVLVNIIRPALVMRVTSDYYYAHEKYPHDYYHRHKAEVVQIDPDGLWNLAGRQSEGQSIYNTLIRCANEVTDAQFKALVG